MANVSRDGGNRRCGRHSLATNRANAATIHAKPLAIIGREMEAAAHRLVQRVVFMAVAPLSDAGLSKKLATAALAGAGAAAWAAPTGEARRDDTASEAVAAAKGGHAHGGRRWN
jgi:hypothetical protein